MEIKKLSEIFDYLKGNEKKRLVVANPIDSHSIEAVAKAVGMGIVDAVLVGDEQKIKAICEQEKIDVGQFRIVHTEANEDPARKAVALINAGEGELLMKGLVSTDVYMRAILNKENGLLPPKAVLSHVTVIENAKYHKLMVVSDVAIIPAPDLKQKSVMIGYIVKTAKALGIETPKVALIAATEQVLPGMQACVDAAMLAKMSERGQIKGAIVDGPLALDVAVDGEAAEIKGLTSPVAGDADCLLFPNIEAGNVFYKMNTKLCDSEQAAFVAGAKVPCILSSRGDSTQTKLNSIALSALLG
ncbi:bifunctional enoyl-CoA hydratase/phosphate acetyltransferase [Prolixibacteraceae bacterium JC049]|nr:bifunctional enoyl-CoA hydratase/phosphate acetyltransferase [Prolixibacteraceae bacterium JC049]